MELHNLKPEQGAVRKSKRVGRGQGSGKGGTSARGHKGAKSRSGYKQKRKFEGGQTPLQMRVPKRGFNSPNRHPYTIVNLYELQHYAEKFGTEQLDLAFFESKRIARRTDRVKILGNGELTSSVKVQAHAVSASAKAAIEKAGGTVELLVKEEKEG